MAHYPDGALGVARLALEPAADLQLVGAADGLEVVRGPPGRLDLSDLGLTVSGADRPRRWTSIRRVVWATDWEAPDNRPVRREERRSLDGGWQLATQQVGPGHEASRKTAWA